MGALWGKGYLLQLRRCQLAFLSFLLTKRTNSANEISFHPTWPNPARLPEFEELKGAREETG